MNDAFDDPTLQALLDAERQAEDGPPDALRDPLFGRVMASVAVPVPPVDPSTAAGPLASGAELSAASSTAGSAAVGAAVGGSAVSGTKLWVVIGALVAGLGAGRMALRETPTPEPVPPPAAAVEAPVTAPTPPTPPASAPASEAPAVAPPPEARPMPLRRGPAAVARQARLRRKKTPRRVAPKPAPAVVAPAPVAPPPVEVRRDTALAAERAALAEGAVALRKGDAVAALAAVRRHRARFPAGRMIEEREVLRIRALVAADRLGDARAAADVFRARFPRSVFRGAVEAALTERAVRNPE